MKKLTILLITCLVSMQIYAINIAYDDSPTKTITGLYDEPLDQYLDTIEFKNLSTSVLFLPFDSPEYSGLNTFQIGYGNSFTDFLYLSGNLSIGNFGDNTTESETLVPTVTTTGILTTGRQDVITATKNYIKNDILDSSMLVGLNLKSFILGIKVRAALYDSSNYNQYTIAAPTISVFDVTPSTALAFTGATSSTTTSDYNANGDIYKKVVDFNDPDGYYMDKINIYSIDAGTELNIAKFSVGVRSTLSLTTVDESEHAKGINYTTYFNPLFPDRGGIDSPNTYTVEESTVTDMSNKLALLIGGDLDLPIMENFDFSTGFSYKIDTDLSSDGRKTSQYDKTSYTAVTSGEFVNTASTSESFTITEDTTWVENSFILPVIFKSNFSDKFNIALGNSLQYDILVNNTDTSTSYTKVEETTSTDSLVPDTKKTTSRKYYGTTSYATTTTLTNTTATSAQFFLTDKVRINLGSSITVTPVTSTKTEINNTGIATETVTEVINNETVTTGSDAANDTYVNDPKISVVNLPVDTDITYKLGLTYFFNDHMNIDLYYAASEGGSDLWTIGNWSLLLTAKF